MNYIRVNAGLAKLIEILTLLSILLHPVIIIITLRVKIFLLFFTKFFVYKIIIDARIHYHNNDSTSRAQRGQGITKRA